MLEALLQPLRPFSACHALYNSYPETSLWRIDGEHSDDDSSDSDGGPGFFDGINDNPTPEQFLVAFARNPEKKKDDRIENDYPLSDGGQNEDDPFDGKENYGILLEPTKKKNESGSKGKQKRQERMAGLNTTSSPATVSSTTPSNFSKVDTTLPISELKERFPMFLEAETCTVDIKEGQMLFLPAGWFHEVNCRK